MSEHARGRQATTPSQIPARGWWDILKRTFSEVSEDRVLLVAAGVTFYLLLALIPGLAAFIGLYGLFFDPTEVRGHIQNLAGLLPPTALELISAEAGRIVGEGRGTLSVAFLVGLGVSLWSANAGMKAMIDALNVVNDEDEKRSFIALNATSLSMTVIAIGLLILLLSAMALVPLLLAALAPARWVETLLSIGRWPVMLVLVALALAALYRFGPSRARPQWRWITWGSALAAVLWLLGSMLFSWYVTNLGNYTATYGSLGTVIALMTWLWLSTTVILLGAELNSEIEHQTARDTTVGPEKPLGARGATMADTIGRSYNGSGPDSVAQMDLAGVNVREHVKRIDENVRAVGARFASAARQSAMRQPTKTLGLAVLGGFIFGALWKA